MSRRPDYRIAALNKKNEDSGTIGAAWKKDNGQISVVFNPFVVVPVGREYVITMFPSHIGEPEPQPENKEN